MNTYVVMAPPGFDSVTGDPRQTDRLAFVPDRFSVLAVLFSVFWALAHRMWLVALGYLAFTLALEVLALAVGSQITGIAALLAAILFGLEAQALRRWSLKRKGWRAVGVVDGADVGEAELRFFHKAGGRTEGGPGAPSPKPARERTPPPRIVPRIGSEQVVGLTLGPETRQ